MRKHTVRYSDYAEQLARLIRAAERHADRTPYYDGHLTVMRFTTNWRVGFGTPEDRDDIDRMACGETLIEALANLLKREGVTV